MTIYRLRRIIMPIGFILFIFGPSVFIPYIFDSFNIIHQPATECPDKTDQELFCEQRYYDDGHVRISSKASELPNCCIMERQFVDSGLLSYRVRACDAGDQSKVECGAVESYGIYDWGVGGRDLTVDLGWRGHKSEYLYDLEEGAR
ncbi:hypothetical protein [uncultured Roseibium sp.]|uniref:hypothetical protein n=1 Tax=uncultured Roseibium sp. TaxID=1936171 RepID=UPI003217DED7